MKWLFDAKVDTLEYAEKIFLPDYMNVPYNAVEGEKIPVPGFPGNSIWRIFNVLNERQIGIYKDEFETTPQFIERRKKELWKPIMGTINLGDKLAFRSEVLSEYDADKVELKISFPKFLVVLNRRR